MLNLSISYVFHHFSTSRQVVEKLIIIKLPPYLGGSKSINTFIRVGYKLNFWIICPKVKTSGHIDPKLITPRHDVDNLSPSWREVTKYTFFAYFCDNCDGYDGYDSFYGAREKLSFLSLLS